MMIKICGITNLDDARAAVENGATALGFNFFPASPRFVTVENAGRVIASLPSTVWKVGVFVNMAPEQVAETARTLALDVAQLHGDETPAQFPRGIRVWKAVRVDGEFQADALAAYPAEAVLLDSGGTGLYGGSGQTFDWSRAAASQLKIVLAGGLEADNVARAIEQARPWGVDACSRIESSPGKKDHSKMAAFLKAALRASQS
jgi:phosphoribosylanthranilate isomerase